MSKRKVPHHYNIVKKRNRTTCTEEGCTTPEKYIKGGVKGKCKKHGGFPICTEDGCTTPQLYMEGGVKGKCIKHGGFPICTKDGCTTPQKYTEGGVKGKCCKHGGLPICTEDGCTTPQQYKEGGVKGKCGKHGGLPRCVGCRLNMVNRQGKRCMTCTPGSKIARRDKKEETQLEAVLLAAGFVFQREQHISYQCFASDDNKKFARLDFLIEYKDKRVILECDEHQHKDQSYPIECDLSRMMYVMTAIQCSSDATRPTLWIRFNPNAYTVDSVPQKRSRKDRYTTLVETIRSFHMGKQNMSVVYMYYDVSEGIPYICHDPAYSKDMKQFIISIH